MADTAVNSVIETVCPAFGVCGGCQFHDIPYEQELCQKEAMLVELLSVDEHVLRPIVPSPRVLHYRSRIDLRLRQRRNGDIHIGFSPKERGPVVEVDHCPIALEAISAFIPTLREEAPQKLSKDYRMANLTVRCGEDGQVRWGGIGRRSLRLKDNEYFFTSVNGYKVHFSLDTFFQANLSILPVLCETLRALPFWSKETIFLDLYGGVGLFSLMLHDLVGRVVDIEENVHAIRLARWNMMANRIGNMDVMEGRVEDVMAKALDTLEQGGPVMMVDPPRAGLGEGAIDLLNSVPRAQQLIYLSCSPESLSRDLKGLGGTGWRIESVQPFDFFPRTRHIETLVILNRDS